MKYKIYTSSHIKVNSKKLFIYMNKNIKYILSQLKSIIVGNMRIM